MGSIIGGLKAGTVASLYFAGSASVFNALILLSSKSEVISYIETNSPAQCSAAVPAGLAGSGEACFSTLLYSGIPQFDFIRIFVIAFFFSLSIAIYFDFIPGSTYTRRTLLASLIMLIVMFFLSLYGLVIDGVQQLLMISFEIVGAVFFAVIFAQLYRKFTREVEFQTQKAGMKIKIDKRDVTGKKRTFTTNSTHKIAASSEGKPFREWLVSGGVSVRAPKESETTIKIIGDGLLKAA